jgi:hypothetical protein
VQLAPVLSGNAVEHARGVEGTHHLARPPLALEQPAQDDGVDLVRIHKAAILGHRTQAVGIAIGGEAGVALLLHHRFLKSRNVRKDGLRVDAGEKRIYIAANLDMLDAALFENSS